MAEVRTIGQIGGVEVQTITLSGPGGLRLTLMNWGARIAELWVPDRNGVLADVVLGQDSLAGWRDHGRYFGAICGRFANRIAGGRFTLDGREVQVDRNEGRNHLHGGAMGFDQKVWQVDDVSDGRASFAMTSPDGEMGYPGTVAARVSYRMTGTGVDILMTATTDVPTVVNLANHAYFNLAGHGAGDVMDHLLQIDAGFYVPVDAELIPTGEVLSVAGTAFDFRTGRRIGARLPGPAAFDHTFCLSAALDGHGLRPALVATDPGSGRSLRLSTSEPGVQVYTGGHFQDLPGKAGALYPRFAGFAVETQRFPDAPNRPQFPTARLDPGAEYRHRTRLEFAIV